MKKIALILGVFVFVMCVAAAPAQALMKFQRPADDGLIIDMERDGLMKFDADKVMTSDSLMKFQKPTDDGLIVELDKVMTKDWAEIFMQKAGLLIDRSTLRDGLMIGDGITVVN